MKNLKKVIIRTEDAITHLKDLISNDKREYEIETDAVKKAELKESIELNSKKLIKMGRELKKLKEAEKFEKEAEKERERAARDSEGEGKE